VKRVFVNCDRCAIVYNNLMVVAYSFDYSNVSKTLGIYTKDSNCFGSLDLDKSYLKFQRISEDNVKFYKIVDKYL